MSVQNLDNKASDIVDWANGKELPDKALILSITADVPLTESARKQLAVMTLPQTANLPVPRQCEVAGIARSTYYETLKNPEFHKQLAIFSRRIFDQETPRYAVKYSEIAKNGDRQALERVLEQTGVLDPPQRNVNVRGSIVKADLGELLALIKEQQIDSEDISDVVDVIEEEIAALRGEEVEGSTAGEGEVPGIPKENIGLSLSEKNKNGSHLPESPASEKIEDGNV